MPAKMPPESHILRLEKNTRDPSPDTMPKITARVPCNLTQEDSPSNMHTMAHTFLTFDFGGNEAVAQLARHKVDAWKQGFRLGKKLELKFDRKGPETGPDGASDAPAKVDSKAKGPSKTKSKSGDKAAKAHTPKTEMPAQIRLIVRLDFSDHEKLSNQRWLERIPAEEPFKTASSKIVRASDPEFKTTAELFDSLD
jgi:hypothetical protein